MTVTPTVRIKSDIPGCEGGLDINASDFNPEIHELFEAAPDDLTPESIAKMPKAEILKLLPDADDKTPVADLRAQLIAALFPDA